jgi:hypothetical protein
VVAAGRDSAHSLLHVSYAIPGSALHEVPSERGHLYPVRLRLSVADRVGIPVATVDTTRLFIAREAVPPGEHLVGRLAVPVIPGNLIYRLAVEQGDDNGIILAADTVSVGDFTGSRFELSGVVLGAREANLTWRPATGDTVYFNPLGRYRRTMEVYYEVYGLLRRRPSRRKWITMKEGRFPASSGPASRRSALTEARRRTETCASQRVAGGATGRYWIEVVVTDAVGSVRESRARFEVRD